MSMKNDQYLNLKNTAARIYQRRTEELAVMKNVPESKRDDGWKYRNFWMKEAAQNCHRSPGEKIYKNGKLEGILGQGLLSSLHSLVNRRDPGYIIPSMSCLKREETK